MPDREDLESGDFRTEPEDARAPEGLNLRRPDGTIASGFDADAGRGVSSATSGVSSPGGPPPEEARREGEPSFDANPSLDPAGIAQQVTGATVDEDQPPADDGYVERPAGRDPVEAAALDLENQIRSEHA